MPAVVAQLVGEGLADESHEVVKGVLPFLVSAGRALHAAEEDGSRVVSAEGQTLAEGEPFSAGAGESREDNKGGETGTHFVCSIQPGFPISTPV